jgi:hypothetical protein
VRSNGSALVSWLVIPPPLKLVVSLAWWSGMVPAPLGLLSIVIFLVVVCICTCIE